MNPEAQAGLAAFNVFWELVKFLVGLIVIIVFFYSVRNLRDIKDILMNVHLGKTLPRKLKRTKNIYGQL
jgi:hypothetical protein